MGYIPILLAFILTILIAYEIRDKQNIGIQVNVGKIPIFTMHSGARFIIALSIPIGLLLSLRYGIGSDYFNYELVYNQVIAGGTYTEIGYAWLMKVSYWLFRDYKGAIATTSILTVILWMTWLYKVTVEKCDLVLAALILLTLYIGSWFNTIQQAIASGITALAFLAAEERKPIKYYLLVVAAGMMHTSAFVILPFYFIYDKKTDVFNDTESRKKRIRKIIVLSAACVALYILYYTHAISRGYLYSHYITQTYEGGRIREFFFYQLLFYVPELVFLPKLIKKSEKNVFYYIMIVFEAVLFLASFRIAYSFRMAEYFSLAHAVIVPKVINEAGINKRLLQTYFVGITIGYTFYMHIINSFDHIFPYVSIFNAF